MTHADLIDRVIAIMGNSDRTPQARAEEVVALVLGREFAEHLTRVQFRNFEFWHPEHQEEAVKATLEEIDMALSQREWERERAAFYAPQYRKDDDT